MDEIKENFKNKFEFFKNGYSGPTDFKEAGIVGFSVFKDQEQLGKKDFKSLYKIYIKKEELDREEDKKSIIATAVYGKMDESGSLITYANDFRQGLSWPVELFSEGDFFYNIKTKDLFHKDKIITGAELLNWINDLHLKSSKPIKGIWLRVKLLFFRVILAGFYKLLFYLFSGVQYIISGKKANFYSFEKDLVGPGIKLGKELDIFGYKVEAWIGVIYALIHLIVYYVLFYRNFRPLILTSIFKNPFLTVMYIVVSLGLLDAVLSKLPRLYLTRGILTFLRDKYIQTISKRIKV